MTAWLCSQIRLLREAIVMDHSLVVKWASHIAGPAVGSIFGQGNSGSFGISAATGAKSPWYGEDCET